MVCLWSSHSLFSVFSPIDYSLLFLPLSAPSPFKAFSSSFQLSLPTPLQFLVFSMGSRIQSSKVSSKEKGKRELDVDDDIEEEEDEVVGMDFGEDDKKKKGVVSRRGSSGGVGGIVPPCCQAEKCTADLTDAKRYYRRHKVCEHHSKAPVVFVGELRQRFCQQCSRFHELSEFDDAKRSCRRRLAGHNERRRKNSSELNGEGSNNKRADPMKETHCRQVDQGGRLPVTISGNSKHFHIR